MKKNRIIFMGTPAIAATTLDELNKKYDVLFAITQPDKKKDRKGNYIYGEVKEYCIKNNIKFFQPEKIKDLKNKIINAKPDLIITCAYGQFVPESILNIPKFKSVNFHASLLPKLRGGAPIQWAIINGFVQTGVTLMYMDKKMDHGNIISSAKIDIDPFVETYDSLYKKMQQLISVIINEQLDQVFSENVYSIEQNEEDATYGLNIAKSDRYINWNLEGENIVFLVNGLNSNPYALTIINDYEFKIAKVKFENKKIDQNIKNGKIVKMDSSSLQVKVKNGIIHILQLQAPNKKMLDIKSFLNGNNFFKEKDYFSNLYNYTK